MKFSHIRQESLGPLRQQFIAKFYATPNLSLTADLESTPLLLLGSGS